MHDLFRIGIACVIAAIVGGGLSLLGVELPVVSSIRRQAILFAVGILLIAAWQWTLSEESMKNAGFPNLANSTFTMTRAVDGKGGDWSGSTIKFTKQSLDLGRRKLTVEGSIQFIQNPYQQTGIDGHVGFRGEYLPNKRSLSLTSAEGVKCTTDDSKCWVSEDWHKTHICSLSKPQYYFALLSPDERRLTDGTWSRQLYNSCNPSPDRWEASR